jgi:16S rRNA G527 N7-methylase RsmG
VEATRKKCAFLKEVVEAQALRQASVHWARVEAPTQEIRDLAPFDVALARAVGRPLNLWGGIRPLLRRGGTFWAFASPTEEGATPWPSADQPITGLIRISAR